MVYIILTVVFMVNLPSKNLKHIEYVLDDNQIVVELQQL